MRGVLRPNGLVALALFAAACVPSEDQSNQAADSGNPAPARAPGNVRALGSPRASARPLPPNASALGEGGMPRADGAMNPMAARGDAGLPHAGDAGTAAAKPAGPPDAPIKAVYYDNFDRVELGAEWTTTSPEWRLQAGRLCGRNAKNHPAWLNRKLPLNARIEFDAISNSPDGDLKAELWGDGKSFAKGTSYNDATSYLAILGGWKNTFHVLARLDEHKKSRPEVKINPTGKDLRARPVQQGRLYHFKVERTDGKTLRWLVDDIDVLTFADPEPLKGKDHEHLGFNDWEVPVCFDNLKITPLPGG
jgi:hypothetical protein